MKNLKNILKTTLWLYLIIISGFFSTIDLFSMRMTERGKENAQKYIVKIREKEFELAHLKSQENKRGLLIFLDDSEKGELEAVSNALMTALYQEAGPIIVSSSLLYNVLEYRKKDVRSTDDLLDDIFKKFADMSFIEKMASSAVSTSLKKDSLILGTLDIEKEKILVSRMCFYSDRWIIKKINDSLNLLIPKKYLKHIDVSIDGVFGCCQNVDSSSEIELKLGLKVNHMKTIKSSDIQLLQPRRFADYFIDSLDSIFCKKSDYKQRMDRPEWYVYIEGHGAMNTAITCLSIDGFKQWLTFLEHKISTQLLVVQSCFAAGVNANTIYGDMKSGIRQQCSFPIIIKALNDVSSGSLAPKVIFDYSRKDRPDIKVFTPEDFVSFLQNAKQLEGNYNEIIKPIVSIGISSMPQIKLPGVEWLSVLDADKKIVSIGSVLAKTRNPQEPLNIKSFFKKDPEVLLLYTDDIPFELEINSNHLKAIVPMVPGKFVVNRIKKISASQDFLEILNWFGVVAVSDESKMFLIDTIKSTVSGWFSTQVTEYKNVLAFCTKDLGVKFYWRDNKYVLCTAELSRSQIDQIQGTEVTKAITNIFNPIELKKVEKDSQDEKDYYMKLVKADKYPMESKQSKREELTPEHIKNIENTLKEQKQFKNIKKTFVEQHTGSMQEIKNKLIEQQKQQMEDVQKRF